MNKPVSDVSFTHLGWLRDQCVKNLHESPKEEWSHREVNAILWLAGYHSGLRLREEKLDVAMFNFEEEPLVIMAERDIEDLKLPKWVTLTGWLAPEGLASSAPDFVRTVANFALRREPHTSNLLRKIPPSILNA